MSERTGAPLGRSLVTGAAGGFFSGLSGVGGGALLIPLMTGLLGYRQHVAHGTSLFVIVFAAAASLAVYAAQGSVDVVLTGTLLAGSLAGAYAGARFAQRIPARRLRQLLGGFLFLVGLRLLIIREVDPAFAVDGAAEAAIGAGIGLAGGLLAGTLGVGGGAIFVPALVLLLGTGQHQAQGVSLAVIVFTAGAGAATHYRYGTVRAGDGGRLAVAAVPAGIAGAALASVLGAEALRAVFAVIVLAVGVTLALTSHGHARGSDTPAGTHEATTA